MSGQHTPHPDPHTHGLADDCPRCAEHAENPWYTLDQRNLRAIVDRTLAYRFGGHYTRHGIETDSPFGSDLSPRSEVEAIAMANVMTLLERVGKISECAPDLLALYLRERWHAPLGVIRGSA